MSIATFESPVTGSQLFFSWVENEGGAFDSASEEVRTLPMHSRAATRPQTSYKSIPQAPVEVHVAQPELRQSNGLPARATQSRLASPVRLGTMMIQLLKSYGITDEEIAEGLAAYAAKNGLAQAG